eukprot:1578362-Rhodomonas_salina.1
MLLCCPDAPCFRLPNRAHKPASTGGVEAVVEEVMRAHAQSAAVQEFGCGVLMHLTASAPRFHDAIVSAGGVEAVAEAMSRLCSRAGVAC